MTFSLSIHPIVGNNLAIVNNVTINLGMQVTLLYAYFDPIRYISRNGIEASYKTSTSIFLRKLHIDFHSGFPMPTNSDKVFFLLPNMASICCFLVSSMVAILTRVRWNLSEVFMCISMVDKDLPIFSYIYWPFVLDLKNVCSVHLLTY
jgi:hypothetical protein